VHSKTIRSEHFSILFSMANPQLLARFLSISI
jgi:hypothetical protein